MELICPECRGELQPSAGKMVVCPLHGGEYEVLFDRASVTAAAVAPPAGELPAPAARAGRAVCAAHPQQPAAYYCNKCGKPLCTTCDFAVDGGHYCGDCAIPQAAGANRAQQTTKTCRVCDSVSPVAAPTCFSCGHTFGLLEGIAPPAPVVQPPAARLAPPAELKCAQHPDVAAVQRCKVCRRGICATCDFTFAGNVHVCPTCVDAQSSAGLSPARRQKMLWSLGLALWSTILLAVMFTPLLYQFEDATINELIAGAIGFGVLIPTIIGVSMGFSAYDRRLHNPWGVVAAVWWNSLLLAFYLVLCVIGVVAG